MVTVDIIAGVSARAVHMVQQVPAKDDLAEFSIRNSGTVNAILVSSTKLGMCQLAVSSN